MKPIWLEAAYHRRTIRRMLNVGLSQTAAARGFGNAARPDHSGGRRRSDHLLMRDVPSLSS